MAWIRNERDFIQTVKQRIEMNIDKLQACKINQHSQRCYGVKELNTKKKH